MTVVYNKDTCFVSGESDGAEVERERGCGVTVRIDDDDDDDDDAVVVKKDVCLRHDSCSRRQRPAHP